MIRHTTREIRVLSRRMSACYTRALVNGTMDAQKRLVIAIDGPSGAGKGTIARAVARHLATGTSTPARCIARSRGRRRERQVPFDDEAAVAALAAPRGPRVGERVAIDGHDVTTAIRTPEMDRAAATVARMPACGGCSSPASGHSATAAAWSWKGATSARWCSRGPT